MFGDPPQQAPLRLSFLLIPGYSMLGVTAMIDPLRWANRISEQSLYLWELVSLTDSPVCASNGLSLSATRTIDEVETTDVLIVCAGFDPHRHESSALFGSLRRLAQRGVDIGGQDTGSHLLAKSGLLDGYRTAIHWENLGSFVEAFPRVKAVDEIFEIDRNRFSCSGGLSGLDMMLFLIESQCGGDISQAVSDELIYTQRRSGDHPQRMTVQARFGVNNIKLISAIKLMQRNQEDPIPIAALAVEVHVSERELERLFRKFLNITPSAFYRELRLDRARLLLHQTTRNVTNVAVACGFASVSHFSRCYMGKFGLSPSKDRQVETYDV